MLLLLLLLPLCWAVEVKRPRGVSLSNHHFYDESKPFTCLDGTATIPFDQVNDDYCDCKDGSDEPGTAACPNGSFHCTNTGYKPLYILSSRVNDGVCDCCDGTDEYNSGTVCENTCREKGRKEKSPCSSWPRSPEKGSVSRRYSLRSGRQLGKKSRVSFLSFRLERSLWKTR